MESKEDIFGALAHGVMSLPEAVHAVARALWGALHLGQLGGVGVHVGDHVRQAVSAPYGQDQGAARLDQEEGRSLDPVPLVIYKDVWGVQAQGGLGTDGCS